MTKFHFNFAAVLSLCVFDLLTHMKAEYSSTLPIGKFVDQISKMHGIDLQSQQFNRFPLPEGWSVLEVVETSFTSFDKSTISSESEDITNVESAETWLSDITYQGKGCVGAPIAASGTLLGVCSPYYGNDFFFPTGSFMVSTSNSGCSDATLSIWYDSFDCDSSVSAPTVTNLMTGCNTVVSSITGAITYVAHSVCTSAPPGKTIPINIPGSVTKM